MKKFFTLNISVIIFLLSIYGANYLLLKDNCLHTSISSMIASANHLNGHAHLIVLALIPIYIATMIFGAGVLGIYVSSLLQHIAKIIYKQ